jgi:oligopeptide transport system substrate-binding protein
VIKFLAILSLISISSCRRIDTKPQKNFLQVSLSSEISTLDPVNSYDTVSATVVYQVYESLYEYHYLKRPFTLQPLLAKEMPLVENGGTRFVIKLQDNVLYHSDKCLPEGRKVTSKDFVTQFKRIAYTPSRSNGWWIFDNKIVGLNEFRNEVGNSFEKFENTPVKGLSTPDDHTLVIDLIKPYPQLQYILAMSFTTPMPIELVKCYDNNLSQHMVGTGPFSLESYTPGSFMKLKKFENYRKTLFPSQGDRYSNDQKLLADANKTLPFVDGINFYILKEEQTRWLNFLSGKLDFLVIPKDNYSTAIDPSGSLTNELKSKNVELYISPTLTLWWISFNMKDPILGKNLLLRQAIAHAIDIDKYIQYFTNNVAQRANSIYPTGIFGYDPSQELPFNHDVEKAKSLLAKAGHPNGNGLPEFTYDVRSNTATNRQQAEFIKAELAKIGINVKIELNTFPAFLEKMRLGKLQMWQDGWALDYPDAENVLQLLSTSNHPPGPNSTYYSNVEIDQLFEKVKYLEDGAEKKATLEKIEAIINKDLPWIMQFYARVYILYNNRLKNFRYSDLVNNYMKYLRLE